MIGKTDVDDLPEHLGGLAGDGLFHSDEAQFWCLSVVLGIVMGDAVRRPSHDGLMTPKSRTAEFFGFFNFSGKATSWLGTFLFGAVIARTAVPDGDPQPAGVVHRRLADHGSSQRSPGAARSGRGVRAVNDADVTGHGMLGWCKYVVIAFPTARSHAPRAVARSGNRQSARAGGICPCAAGAICARGTPESAYADRALAIECQQTISQPYIVGFDDAVLRVARAGTRARNRHRQRLPGGHPLRVGRRRGERGTARGVVGSRRACAG